MTGAAELWTLSRVIAAGEALEGASPGAGNGAAGYVRRGFALVRGPIVGLVTQREPTGAVHCKGSGETVPAAPVVSPGAPVAEPALAAAPAPASGAAPAPAPAPTPAPSPPAAASNSLSLLAGTQALARYSAICTSFFRVLALALAASSHVSEEMRCL